jgi:hypothetical protein
MNAAMKTIQKIGSLKLHKETLRSLSPRELADVNGASAGGHMCASDVCPTLTDLSTVHSIVDLACGSGIHLPGGAIDPDISHISNVRP